MLETKQLTVAIDFNNMDIFEAVHMLGNYRVMLLWWLNIQSSALSLVWACIKCQDTHTVKSSCYMQDSGWDPLGTVNAVE